MYLTARARRHGLVAGAVAVALVIPVAIVVTAPQTRAASLHSRPSSPTPVGDEPAVDALAPSPTALAAALQAAPVHLPFLGTGGSISAVPAPAPRAGSYISVPSVGLQIGVVDYTDCNGNTAMTRSNAVHFTCTPGAVSAFVGHNPGVFTPLTRSHTGDRVHYGHDGVDTIFVISEIHRVSPQDAAAYSQDGSYQHAVFATCAEPDSSAYWIFIALPDGAVASAGGHPAPASGSSGGPGAPPAPTPTPTPTPSPTPAGTRLPGGITIPPPPG